jgi:O-antigen ligase
MKFLKYLLFFYLIIFPLGQFLRIPPQSKELSEIHTYLTDIMAGIIFLTSLLLIFIKKPKISFPLFVKPLVIFIVVCLLSLLVNLSHLEPRQMLVSFLYLWRWVAYFGIFLGTYLLIKKKEITTLRIQSWLIGVGFVSVVFGLIQYFFMPDTRFIADFGWDPHYYRLIGAFLDPGFLGLIILLTLILLTLRIWDQKKPLDIILWVLTYAALALTYSRASYFAFVVAMGMIALYKKAPKFFIGIVIAGIITIFLLPRPGGEGVRLERESTIRFRITSWQHALIVTRDNPILGVGFNSYRYIQQKYNFFDDNEWEVSHGASGADSSLLFILATTGIIGLFAYLWVWHKIIYVNKGNIIVISSIAAVFIHSFFLNSLFYPWIMGWMWILIASAKENKSP